MTATDASSNIARVGVVGCGLMGSGIAQVCAGAGIPTVVCELDEDALPAEAQYDWVRVYRRNDQPTP